MHLIGINGFKRSGKGASAMCVATLATGKVVQVGFADKLKVIGARTLGFKGDDAGLIEAMDTFKLSGGLDVFASREGPAWPDWSISGRQFLQNLGNDARDVFHGTFWIDQVLPMPSANPARDVRAADNQAALEALYPDAAYVVITDLRYPNEAQRIKNLGGTVWEVVRPGTESDGHASEQPLPASLVDRQLMNVAGLDNLRWEVEKALELL